MATIVYEGAVGGGGNLFEGKKFWVSVKVPQRDRWVAGIQNNGGSIVKLEKQADFMIDDHIKKDAPQGSYSWKYIEAALKDGRLPAPEDYLIKSKSSIRHVGTSAPGKSTRTPFTAADDDMLLRWVLKGERRGVALLGNELYKDLERVNNRHTYQSWRDRWVKVLSSRPRPDIDLDDDSADSTAAVLSPAPPKSKTPPVRLRQASNTLKAGVRSRVSSRPKGTPRAPTPILHAVKSPVQNPVSAEDIKMLLNDWEAIENIDPEKESDAWKAWSAAHPQHTAQQWVEIWKKDVRPIRQKSVLDGNRNETVSNVDTSPRGSSPVARITPEKTQRSSLPPNGSVQKSSENANVSLRSSPPAAKTIPEKTQQSPVPPSSSAQYPELQRSNPGRTSNLSNLMENIDQLWSSPTSSSRMKPLSPDDRSKFNRCILLFHQERNVNIDLCPSIEGKDISLYELYTYVRERGGSEIVQRDGIWPQIASRLNFNVFKHKNACEELRSCYEESLMHFEDFQNEQKLKRKDQRRPTAAIKGIVVTNNEDELDDLDSPYILPRSLKRQPSPAQQRAESRQSHFKSRRFNKEIGVMRDEIPSTPEAIFKKPALYETSSSPLRKSQSAAPNEVEEEEDPLAVFDEPLERNLFGKKAGAAAQNPKTQDFGYPELDLDDEEDVITYPDLPDRPGTGESQLLNLDDDKEVIEYREHWMSLGYPQEVIDEAMRVTTMDLELMPLIMEFRMKEKEEAIPDNEEGVWTTEDDQVLLNQDEDDSEGFDRITRKHTTARVEMRERFLRDMGLLTSV